MPNRIGIYLKKNNIFVLPEVIWRLGRQLTSVHVLQRRPSSDCHRLQNPLFAWSSSITVFVSQRPAAADDSNCARKDADETESARDYFPCPPIAEPFGYTQQQREQQSLMSVVAAAQQRKFIPKEHLPTAVAKRTEMFFCHQLTGQHLYYYILAGSSYVSSSRPFRGLLKITAMVMPS